MWPLLLLALVAFAGGAAAKKKSSGASRGDGGMKQSWSPPPPPPQSGSQPDPEAPNDPDRGRFYTLAGGGSGEGYVFDDAFNIVRIADEATGTLILDVYETVDGAREFWGKGENGPLIRFPKNCRARRWKIDFVDGRPVSTTGPMLPKQPCSPDAKPIASGLPVTSPSIEWTQQGNWVVMLWSMEGLGTGETKGGGNFFDPEVSVGVSFNVDVFWSFEVP